MLNQMALYWHSCRRSSRSTFHSGIRQMPRSNTTCALPALPAESSFSLSALAINLFNWKFFHISVYYRVHFHFRPKIFFLASFFISTDFSLHSFLPVRTQQVLLVCKPREGNIVRSIFFHFFLDISSDVAHKLESSTTIARSYARLRTSLKSKYINSCPWIFIFLK